MEENAQEYETYHADYEARRALATDVTIALDAVQTVPDTVTIQATVCLGPAGEAKPMRIYVVQVLDRWPPETSYSRNGFKQAGTAEDVALSAGQCQTIERTFTLDADSQADPGNVRIIAWAQAPQPAGPAEVYQAAMLSGPFVSDCNHNSIPDAMDIASGTSADCNANGIPDDCEVPPLGPPANDCNGNHVPDVCDIAAGIGSDLNHNGVLDHCEGLGDMNCDGAMNFDDINPFVLALVGETSYVNAHPNCRWLNGDINGDGAVNFDDINPFVVLLIRQ